MGTLGGAHTLLPCGLRVVAAQLAHAREGPCTVRVQGCSSGLLVTFPLIQRNTFMLSTPSYPNFSQLVNYINYITCALVCGILNLTRREASTL